MQRWLRLRRAPFFSEFCLLEYMTSRNVVELEPFSARAPLCILPERLRNLDSAHFSPFCSLHEIWADADINLITNRLQEVHLAPEVDSEGLTQWSAVRGSV